MTEIKDEVEAEATRSRPVFLVAAGVCVALVLVAYVFEDAIVSDSAGGQLTFAAMLIFLVLLSMALIFCYRSPRVGNRLLGYDIVISKPERTVKSDVQFSAGFKADTGADTKRMNSARKQARYSRRKLAAVTRQMQKEQAEEETQELKK